MRFLFKLEISQLNFKNLSLEDASGNRWLQLWLVHILDELGNITSNTAMNFDSDNYS